MIRVCDPHPFGAVVAALRRSPPPVAAPSNRKGWNRSYPHHKSKRAPKWDPFSIWRRGRDSNPGWALTHDGFQDRCIQPLCHPSGVSKAA